jgi:hypothetical protein
VSRCKYDLTTNSNTDSNPSLQCGATIPIVGDEDEIGEPEAGRYDKGDGGEIWQERRGTGVRFIRLGKTLMDGGTSLIEHVRDLRLYRCFDWPRWWQTQR